jgi:hypothetical protein
MWLQNGSYANPGGITMNSIKLNRSGTHYINKRGTYAIIDESGKILGNFRLSMAAREAKRELEQEYPEKLTIVKMEDLEK